MKAREVLITGQMPSFEERAVQMETVLHQSVTTSYYGEQGVDHRYASIMLAKLFRRSTNLNIF